MEDDNDVVNYDAFASDGFWKSSQWYQDPKIFDSLLFAPLQLDIPAIKLDHPYAPTKPLDRELQLPDLETFEFGALSELESLEQSTVYADTPDEKEDDVWQAAVELGPANKDLNFFTWEAFEQPGHVERQTSYITESGPEGFDAALVEDQDKTPCGRVLRSDIFLDSLWNLGLGRSSIFFDWNAKKRTFIPSITDGRTSGLSPAASKAITDQFILTGSTFLYLRSFVERNFASRASIPARVALATCISTILSAFEDHLGRHANKIRSLLQLQNLFSNPKEILTHISRTVGAIKHATSNEQLCSILHNHVLELDEGNPVLRKLSAEILRQVSRPSIELLEEWIGLKRDDNTLPFEERGSFVAVDAEADEDRPIEYIYRSEMMPRFFTPEDGHMIFGTGNSLRFLRSHHPDHPLATLEKHGIAPPELEWKFGWHDIEDISTKAKAYEESLRKAILDFRRGRSPSTDQYALPPKDVTSESAPQLPTSSGELEQYFNESARLFDSAPRDNFSGLPDEIQLLTSELLTSKTSSEPASSFSPPISMTSTLSFRPLLAAQAKMVNATTLRLFLRSHKLLMHLSLQRQYQLLGDGVFSSRLASALFDPDRETAQRQKGTMRSGVHMGLQLGSRSTWPPASSELRLALMGVLSESFYSSELYHSIHNHAEATHTTKEKDELPGQLNFSIRQLSEPEMQRIMDPDSLYALDFLRLQYVPPSPLHLVITSASLDKYDAIFRFLLRLLRILFVVARLPRWYTSMSSRLFRTEAHHFVTALSMYIFQTGIAEPWAQFKSYVESIETQLADEDAAGEFGTRITAGVEAIRAAHDQCLDSIMFSVLLRRRQKKVMGLLEEVFELVLRFATMQRDDGKGEGKENESDEVKELYAKLKGRIKVFISVCKGLEGKKGYGKGRGSSEENMMERLGVLLEMNGYYSR